MDFFEFLAGLLGFRLGADAVNGRGGCLGCSVRIFLAIVIFALLVNVMSR